MSKWNSSTISVKLDGLSSYDVGLSVRIDNNNDVWVRASADWSSYKTWSVISRYGSITIYTTGLSETLTTPANSVEISVGQQVRGNQGSISSASAQNNASHVFGAVSSRGAITENGNQVLHAGNYTNYSPSLTGSGASGTWGISISGSAQTVLSGMPNNTDNYMNFRVMRNANSSASNDGMYIGYANTNSGLTRIFGGGSTSGGISVNGPGVNDVTVAGNVVLNAGNYTNYVTSGGGTSSARAFFSTGA